MALRSALLSLAAVASLAACGSRADDPALRAAQGLVSGVLNRDGPTVPAPDLRAVFTRDLIDQAATPLLYVEIDSVNATAILWRIATNASNETWRGEDELSITLSEDGVLRSTRGFIYDLYASDMEGTRAAMASRREGPASRLMIRVAGDLHEVRTGYSCDIRFASAEPVTIFGQTRRLTPMTETCVDGTTGDGFENRYWIDASGFAWASEQWAGAELGHIRIERLYR